MDGKEGRKGNIHSGPASPGDLFRPVGGQAGRTRGRRSTGARADGRNIINPAREQRDTRMANALLRNSLSNKADLGEREEERTDHGATRGE